MIAKPVVPRAAAHADAERALDHYLAEASPEVVLAFIDALEATYAAIGAAPGAGSPRWAHELGLPGLRSLRVRGYPWLVFYFETENHVDVWRILHARRDIPTGMEGVGPEGEA